ncbi:phage major capsid protein [Mycobacteroides abscessus]|uniref:phage major capsid protein n=1 Tax=Mycobacteroides abscessus TaxID=36809 RepID=UPI000C2615FA|nr:phage major capsid protein [Mycobacteroides abscessus]
MTIQTTVTNPDAFALDIQGLEPQKIIPESLAIMATTRVGIAQADDVFVRVPHLDLSDDVAWVPEGTAIPEADPDADESIIATGKLGVLVKLSIEQLRQPNVTEIVSQEIGRSLTTKINSALINTVAPVSPAVLPPAGLIAQGTTVATAVASNLDGIVNAISLIQELPGGDATNVIASPSAWASLQKFKVATGSNASLLDARVDSAEKRLLSVPVHVDSSVPSNKIVVLDKRRVLSAYSDIQVSKSDQAFFASDVVGIKATFRVGAVVTDALAVQVLTITPPA